jgi:hypothetical protein
MPHKNQPKWTLGPWHMAPALPTKIGGAQLIPCFEISGRLDVCWVAQVQEHRNCIATSGDANARLIAAAPDLYAACMAFIEAWEKSLQLEKTDVALQLAKAATAKARGGV